MQQETETAGETSVPISPRLKFLRAAEPNSWIAFSEDETEVLASGKTFIEADREAKKSGKEYFLTKVPPSWSVRIFTSIRRPVSVLK